MKFIAMQARHWPWFASRANACWCEDTKGLVVEDDVGRILAAAAFDSWSHTSCNIHIAIDNPMVIRRGFIAQIKDYVFNQAGRKMMLGFTPANNAKALRFNEKVGMREIFRLKDGYADGVDYVVTRMMKDEVYGTF